MTIDRQQDATSGPYKISSLTILPEHDPLVGVVRWDPARSLWNIAMMAGAVAALFYATPGAIAVFVFGLAFTMCTGHSVGFHRRLIHRTFSCPKWLERVLVYSGTLVGMQGPFWVIHSHDLRDWAQRQKDCHSYLRHGQGMLLDGLLSLHYTLKLANPPAFDPGPGIADDRFYQFLQRTWMAQQIPIAIICYVIGGLPWLLWGVCMRVFVGVSMHWFVGFLCHTHGPQSWLVVDGAVDSYRDADVAVSAATLLNATRAAVSYVGKQPQIAGDRYGRAQSQARHYFAPIAWRFSRHSE
jgi:sn-1 stearoyl-lipid 9-desaturase